MFFVFVFSDDTNLVQVEFYKLIPLDISTSGQAYLDAIKSDLEEENLWNFVKEKIVAVVTDNAANMQASRLGFVNLFKNAIGKSRVMGHKCLAHRLDTILKHAYRSCSNCSILSDFLKSAYSFYSRSPKRLKALKNFCDEKGLPFFKPRKVLEVN